MTGESGRAPVDTIAEVNHRFEQLLRGVKACSISTTIVIRAVGLVERARVRPPGARSPLSPLYVDEYQDLAPGSTG